jgi:two-component system, NarL family, nitrate/nitrite response regulator NarL
MMPECESALGESVRILIVEDHPIVRYGLRRLLESEPGFMVVGEATDGLEALSLARELSPQIMLLDLAIPRRSGLEVLREMAGLGLPTRTIIVTALMQKNEMAQALQLGTRGIILKETAADLILESIRTVMKGQYWVGRESVSDLVELVRRLLPRVPSAAKRANFGLTVREMEVISGLGAGYTNGEIAQKLGVSEQTVKHHLTNIFDKLGLSNRMEVVLFAVSHHLIDEN